MPTHYETRPERGFVQVWYHGTVTVDEIKAMFHQFRTSSAFDPALAHLVDLGDFTGTNAGFAEFFSLFSLYARAYADTATGLRCAIYAPDESSFALARIFENLAETSDVVEARLFDDIDKAKSWASAPLCPS